MAFMPLKLFIQSKFCDAACVLHHFAFLVCRLFVLF